MNLWFEEDDGRKIEVKEIICRKRSKFQLIEILDTEKYGRMLVLDGQVQLTEKDEFIYHEMIVHPAFLSDQSVKDVLIIGGGDGGAVREVLKHPINSVKVVEIDEEVVSRCKEFFALCPDNEKVEFIYADGYKYVKNLDKEVDLIIVDSTSPNRLSNSISSIDFYRIAEKHLRKDGILECVLEGVRQVSGQVERCCLSARFDRGRVYAAQGG